MSPVDEKKPDDPTARRGKFDPLPDWVHPATRLVHGARRPDENAGSVVAPIYQTTTFHYPALYSESARSGKVYLYTRNENPTVEVAAELIRQLEGGQAARLFGSGMGATAATLLSLLRPGQELLALDTLYGGTINLAQDLLAPYGILVRWMSESAARSPEKCVTDQTKLVWIESPTNPLLQVHDVRRWAEVSHGVGACLVVDNTFANPINQNPLALGADLVMHSATKYLGGHTDLSAGAIVGSDELLARIDPKSLLGSVLDPFAAFLLARGMKTLSLRTARQNENGEELARALQEHPKIERVYYPGLGSPEALRIAEAQMRGRGGMVSVVVRGGPPQIRAFLQHLRLVHVATSLGGVESLVSVPVETSHRFLTPEQLRERGIAENLVRFSFGIEETEDLVRDVTEALDAI
ncbi:MAG: aminotransferase class I/II-fold pyridoxal phosphate-dependent enzyme [Thermoplasmata archaeon]